MRTPHLIARRGPRSGQVCRGRFGVGAARAARDDPRPSPPAGARRACCSKRLAVGVVEVHADPVHTDAPVVQGVQQAQHVPRVREPRSGRPTTAVAAEVRASADGRDLLDGAGPPTGRRSTWTYARTHRPAPRAPPRRGRTSRSTRRRCGEVLRAKVSVALPQIATGADTACSEWPVQAGSLGTSRAVEPPGRRRRATGAPRSRRPAAGTHWGDEHVVSIVSRPAAASADNSALRQRHDGLLVLEPSRAPPRRW